MAGAFEFVRVKSLSAETTGASRTDAVIQICAAHNLREGHCYSRDKQSGSIDPARSHLNVTLRGCDTPAEVAQMALDLVRVGGWQKQYRRANASVGAEQVFSLPANTQLDVIAYFRACVDWAVQYFDAPALLATIHLDQQHPHLHLIFLPVRGGQWRGSRFFGKRGAINAMHASFHTAVGKPHGLRRQQQSSESAAIRHVTAAREFDAIMAHHGLMDDPAVRQALVSLIAADPERLRAAREQAMVAGGSPIALPGGAAPGGENRMFYPVIAHSPNAASIAGQNVADADQDAVAEPADHHEQLAALSADPKPQLVTPAPIRIDAEQSTMPTPIGLDQDEPPERVTRVRDDEQPTELWNGKLGKMMLPPAKRPSAKEAATAAVALALGQLPVSKMTNVTYPRHPRRKVVSLATQKVVNHGDDAVAEPPDRHDQPAALPADPMTPAPIQIVLDDLPRTDTRRAIVRAAAEINKAMP